MLGKHSITNCLGDFEFLVNDQYQVTLRFNGEIIGKGSLAIGSPLVKMIVDGFPSPILGTEAALVSAFTEKQKMRHPAFRFAVPKNPDLFCV